jgi:hypothetical protein
LNAELCGVSATLQIRQVRIPTERTPNLQMSADPMLMYQFSATILVWTDGQTAVVWEPP